MKQVYIAIIGLLIISSCTNEPKQKEEQIKETTTKIKVNVPNKEAVQVENGSYQETYPNGAIKIKGQMVSGKKDGVWVAYFQNGLKQSESNYFMGDLNGKSAIFYENGNLRMAGYYDHGLRDGVWRLYKEDGSFDKQINYKDGEKLEE